LDESFTLNKLRYSEDELWENMKIFLDSVLPVAEKLGVKLALHPNDPPTKVKIYGVPSIIRSREAYEKVQIFL
jgi:mannonate dehydratase